MENGKTNYIFSNITSCEVIVSNGGKDEIDSKRL